jgi:hypothetical protein
MAAGQRISPTVSGQVRLAWRFEVVRHYCVEWSSFAPFRFPSHITVLQPLFLVDSEFIDSFMMFDELLLGPQSVG